MKNECYSEKKTFLVLWKFYLQNGNKKNMPVLAELLVVNPDEQSE